MFHKVWQPKKADIAYYNVFPSKREHLNRSQYAPDITDGFSQAGQRVIGILFIFKCHYARIANSTLKKVGIYTTPRPISTALPAAV